MDLNSMYHNNICIFILRLSISFCILKNDRHYKVNKKTYFIIILLNTSPDRTKCIEPGRCAEIARLQWGRLPALWLVESYSPPTKAVVDPIAIWQFQRSARVMIMKLCHDDFSFLFFWFALKFFLGIFWIYPEHQKCQKVNVFLSAFFVLLSLNFIKNCIYLLDLICKTYFFFLS